MERLEYGARGAGVMLAQAALNFQLEGLHPPLVVDGQFGNATRDAVLALQRLAGLRDKDGIIGKDTNGVLFAFYQLQMPLTWRRTPKLSPRGGQSPFGGLKLQPPKLNFPPLNLTPPLLPPLTLPPIGPLAPMPFSLPVLQGGTSNFPARPTEVDLFMLKGQIFKKFQLTLKGSIEGVSDITGEHRVDATSVLDLQIFKAGDVTVSLYEKAVGEVKPNKPGDSTLKGSTGLSLSLQLGTLKITAAGGVEASAPVDVLRMGVEQGQVTGGAWMVGGTLTIGSF